MLETTLEAAKKSSGAVRGPIFGHDNALRLFGPPGAGKTRSLVGWLQEHEAEGDFRVGEGIICSFTRAAAHDIARRVNGEREPGGYHATLHAVSRRWHGMEAKLVTPALLKAFFRGERVEYEASGPYDPESYALSETSATKEGGALVAFWDWMRHRLLSLNEAMEAYSPGHALWPWWDGVRMERIWGKYQAWKRADRLMDYTDMLEASVTSPPTGSWPFFVLDEAQDSTPLQWAVAHAFAACCEVVYLGGDDDQAIYTWAGATPREFLSARVSGETVLHTNHRSGDVIVDAAQAFIRRNRQRRDKGMTSASGGGEIRETYYLPDLAPEESVFLMARAHYLLEPLLQELERARYPFVDARGKHGVTGKDATNYRRYLRLRRGERIALDEWRILAEEAIPSRAVWLTYGAKKRLREMDARFRETTMVGAGDLTMYGATEDLVNAIGSGAPGPLARMNATRVGYLRGVAERWGDEYLDERKAAGVLLAGPVHRFKGLECDHAIIHSGYPPAATAAAMSNPEDERRVMYVAMTRARTRVTHFQSRAFAQWRSVL